MACPAPNIRITQLCSWTALCVAVLAGTVPGHSLIYACRDAQGHSVYTDGTSTVDADCADRQLYTPGDHPPVGFEPLKEAEKRQLADIDARSALSRKQRQAAAASRQRQQATLTVQSEQLCQAATSALASLHAQRRKGYALHQAQALERREIALKAQKQANC